MYTCKDTNGSLTAAESPAKATRETHPARLLISCGRYVMYSLPPGGHYPGPRMEYKSDWESAGAHPPPRPFQQVQEMHLPHQHHPPQPRRSQAQVNGRGKNPGRRPSLGQAIPPPATRHYSFSGQPGLPSQPPRHPYQTIPQPTHIPQPFPVVPPRQQAAAAGDPVPGMPVVDAFNEGVRRQKIGDIKGAVRTVIAY